MQLGDARTGKLADNIAGFGRALRRAGVRVDSARIALATEAATLVGLERREDLAAALESVMVGREQDRLVFRELFDAFFRDPGMAQKLLAQMLPQGEGKAEPVKRRPRGTVYVDYLQNILGKTLAGAYSARAREYGGVAAPLLTSAAGERS